MSRITADMSMSIDGRIATPDDDISPPAGVLDQPRVDVVPIEGTRVTHLLHGVRRDAADERGSAAAVREIEQEGR